MKTIIGGGAIFKLKVSDALKNCLHETVLDKLTVTQLVKKFFVFYGTPRIDTL